MAWIPGEKLAVRLVTHECTIANLQFSTHDNSAGPALQFPTLVGAVINVHLVRLG